MTLRSDAHLSLVKDFVRAVVPRSARNWLRSPSESLRYLYDEGLYRAGVTREHEIRPGWRLTAHPGAFRMAFWSQVRDPEQVIEFDRFVSSCVPNMVLFDVGAHFGLFCLAAMHYAPSSFCVAVEPSDFAVRMLRLHAALNCPERRLIVRHAAAGNSAGTTRMVDVGIQARGYFINAGIARRPSDVTIVPSVTVDGLASEYGVQPTHLKIDVEGDEASVIAGAAATLTGSLVRRPTVFLELHNDIIRARGEAPTGVLETLRAFGYRFETPSRLPVSIGEATAPKLTRLIAVPM